MKDGNEPPTLKEVAAAFFEIAQADLPTDSQLLQTALVSEAIRLSFTNSVVDEEGWRKLHILSLKNWVRRKLRTLIPKVDSSLPKDFIFQTLRDSIGGNLVFLGDVIELANGYYMPSPTRVVPITDDLSLLVSGLPTSLFVRYGLDIRVMGISRAIKESATSLQLNLDIPIQNRDSYLGLVEFDKCDEKALSRFLEGEHHRSWDEAGNWTCYQGNQDLFGFTWSYEEYNVPSPFGFLSLWRAEQEFGSIEYWLRIQDQSRDQMVQVPGIFHKQVILLLDKWGKNPREVMFLESGHNVIVKTRFRPPAAQTRWLHAIGGQWMGGKDNWIRWKILPDTVKSTVDVFERLPVIIERGKIQ